MSSLKNAPHKILRSPRITEKSASHISLGNGVVFEVHPKANKVEIRNAVEKVFDVKVRSVKTINVLGKIKRASFSFGRQKNWKKAYVFLEKGHSIDIMEGL